MPARSAYRSLNIPFDYVSTSVWEDEQTYIFSLDLQGKPIVVTKRHKLNAYM